MMRNPEVPQKCQSSAQLSPALGQWAERSVFTPLALLQLYDELSDFSVTDSNVVIRAEFD
ncbi:hypothetical protein JZ751_021196, partial [Albula glossodonta]